MNISTRSTIGILTALFLIVSLKVQSVFAAEQRISLFTGWNLISINVDPREMYRDGEDRGPDLELMFDQLRRGNRHLLLLMRDQADSNYIPGTLNEIHYWNLQRCFKVKVSADCEVVFTGDRIPADSPIELQPGWNWVAYYPEYELSCSRNTFHAITSIVSNVRMAHDPFGHFASPIDNFSNMSDWQTGRGYMILVDSACTLIYPPPLSVQPNPLVPEGFVLDTPYPNPFNATTTISFNLLQPGQTRLTIFDPFGKQVADLIPHGNLPAGKHNITWNAGDLTSGAYIIRLESESASSVSRAILIR